MNRKRMHRPYLIDKNSPDFQLFQQHFSEFQFLLPKDINALQSQQALQSPVYIRPITECSSAVSDHTPLLVVGGAPALLSSLAATTSLVYLNDNRRWPIAQGAAWALELDACSQIRINGSPLSFLLKQMLRVLNPFKGYRKILRTGFFPWQTLDWCAWLRQPQAWYSALKLAFCFQGKDLAHTEVKGYASLYHHHEAFYVDLNKKLDGKILFPEQGSLIFARNKTELKALYALQKNLAKEGRVLNILSRQEILQRFGFEPAALVIGEKTHDHALSPAFQKTIENYLRQKGNTITPGTLIALYVDSTTPGGIAEYHTAQNEIHFIRFDQLLMSLGHQRIWDLQNKPLFNLVCATGVSVLAHIYTPTTYQFPRMCIFGGTNHCTRLSSAPISVIRENKTYHLHLVRVTAGACITPRNRGKENTYYDNTIAVGLLSALRISLGDACIVTPLFIYGCNRSVSQFGETRWIQLYPGVHVQFGAGGGGLTRAPEGPFAGHLQRKIKK